MKQQQLEIETQLQHIDEMWNDAHNDKSTGLFFHRFPNIPPRPCFHKTPDTVHDAVAAAAEGESFWNTKTKVW